MIIKIILKLKKLMVIPIKLYLEKTILLLKFTRNEIDFV